MERHEQTVAAGEGREIFGKRVAILVAVLAAFLAISSLTATKASEDTILKEIQVADTYAEFQADSLKQRLGEQNAKTLTVLSANFPDQAAAKTAIGEFKADAAKKKAQKEELLIKAKELQGERENAHRRHKSLEVAEAAFQIAIVLASVAIVARAILLVWASGLLGVTGLFFMLNAYRHFFDLPG